MNKRLKKKLGRRGNYRSWKRWKSFDFYATLPSGKRLGCYTTQIAFPGVTKNHRVYPKSVIYQIPLPPLGSWEEIQNAMADPKFLVIEEEKNEEERMRTYIDNLISYLEATRTHRLDGEIMNMLDHDPKLKKMLEERLEEMQPELELEKKCREELQKVGLGKYC